MRSKDKSNCKNPPEKMCLKDGVARAVNVAKSVQAGAGKVDESVHAVAVSFSDIFLVIWIHVLFEFMY